MGLSYRGTAGRGVSRGDIRMMAQPKQHELPLFSARSKARKTDTSTSVLAAEKSGIKATERRLLVLRLLKDRAMTDFELAEASGLQQNSIGKRRGECRDAGWVQIARDGRGTEVRRPSTTQSPALVWEITEAGRQCLAQQ